MSLGCPTINVTRLVSLWKNGKMLLYSFVNCSHNFMMLLYIDTRYGLCPWWHISVHNSLLTTWYLYHNSSSHFGVTLVSGQWTHDKVYSESSSNLLMMGQETKWPTACLDVILPRILQGIWGGWVHGSAWMVHGSEVQVEWVEKCKKIFSFLHEYVYNGTCLQW